MNKKKHVIGEHGAIGFVTKDGRICAECGEAIIEPEQCKGRCLKQETSGEHEKGSMWCRYIQYEKEGHIRDQN